MRIRNRQVPFPLSSTILSDPNLINRSPVLVQLTDATITSPKQSCTHSSTTAPISLSDHPPPSDNQSLPPIRKKDDSQRQQKKEDCLVEEGGEGLKGNIDTRKEGISGAKMSSEQDSRWCRGEKGFPMKKRRGSFENNIINKDNGKKKMKSKKCDDIHEEEEEEQTKREVKVGGNNKKKVRGGAVMEGSRCSRVNGRGWRCCQPTLVGYSLCEHHLGKGRLRSMTSVRNRSSIAATSQKSSNNSNLQDMILSESSSSLSIEKNTKCDSEEDNGEKNLMPPIITTKKRMKLGMVKARSISSLLGQTNKH